jgi:hypothetical protein
VLLDVPYRRIDTVDLGALRATVERLRPTFESDALWTNLAERMQWIGKPERPADVGFRKMVPTRYVQLCIANDEEPRSPWAVDVPDDALSRAERDALVAEWSAFCARHYGPGVLHFLVFAVLGPGGAIPPHRDMPHDVNKKAFSHHLHVPITAAEATEFTLKDEKVVFEAGGVYEIDNMSVHAVVHRGASFRVNLMLDYCPAANLEKRNAPSPPRTPPKAGEGTATG